MLPEARVHERAIETVLIPTKGTAASPILSSESAAVLDTTRHGGARGRLRREE